VLTKNFSLTFKERGFNGGVYFNEYKRLNSFRDYNQVHEKRLKFSQAADILSLSLRHVKRLSSYIKKQGPKGLISKKINMTGNHQLPKNIKDQAISLIYEHYYDFGPTLAHEYLTEKHGFNISISTVRNLMVFHKIWNPKKSKRKRIYQLRTRRSRKGELIQVDGSDHEWFENRNNRCTLLVYVDDATSAIMYMHFSKSETTNAYFEATYNYLQKHGRPLAFYPDKHSVFRVNRKEILSGDGQTQFGRAMEELEIDLICAHSPQAKGRVERRNKDLQDRLVKALRINNISDIKTANEYLPVFIEDFNKRFAKAPLSSSNAHRPLLKEHNLDEILAEKHTRYLSKNLTLQYKNTIYQILTEKENYSMRKAKVSIIEKKSGEILIYYRKKELKAIPYHQQQKMPRVITTKEISTILKEKNIYRPNKYHPWKSKKRGFSYFI